MVLRLSLFVSLGTVFFFHYLRAQRLHAVPLRQDVRHGGQQVPERLAGASRGDGHQVVATEGDGPALGLDRSRLLGRRKRREGEIIFWELWTEW